MRVTLLIDSLGPGGAQRQLCSLASGLSSKGFQVTVVTYHSGDFFYDQLKKTSIPWINLNHSSQLLRAAAVVYTLLKTNPRIVIAFLPGPSILAAATKALGGQFQLITSERSITTSYNIRERLRFLFLRQADAITTNSRSQTAIVGKLAPPLALKTTTIPNCVSLDVFTPAQNKKVPQVINLLVVASLKPAKNCLGLARAMKLVSSKAGDKTITVTWIGHCEEGSIAAQDQYEKLQHYLAKERLHKCFRVEVAAKDILPRYRSCTALCLPSFYEGSPNVIAEAMACGKPVLASNVSDNSTLVRDGENGYLFDPRNPKSIADAILKFSRLTLEETQIMGNAGRAIAEKLLSPDRFLNDYLGLITQTCQQELPTAST